MFLHNIFIMSRYFQSGKNLIDFASIVKLIVRMIAVIVAAFLHYPHEYQPAAGKRESDKKDDQLCRRH